MRLWRSWSWREILGEDRGGTGRWLRPLDRLRRQEVEHRQPGGLGRAPDLFNQGRLGGRAQHDHRMRHRLGQRPFGAHTYPRLAHIGDRTGLELLRTLQDRAVHTKGVDVHMEVTVFRLLTSGGRIAGALAYARADGRLILFRARAVLLATGGGGRAYRVTSNSWVPKFQCSTNKPEAPGGGG